MPVSSSDRPVAAASKNAAKPSPAQQAMRKLGLVRDIDLALHLPLRYEDETRITLLKNAREGDTVQIEATVTDCEVQLRPRRMLKITVDDGSASCQLTFFSFYASQQKAMAVGTRWRIRGEVKGGFWGRQMLHPTYKKPEGALPQALTPIYPVAHGLPQAYIRRAVASALQRVALPETLPEHAPPPIPNYWDGNALKPLLSLREALLFLHNPSPQVALDTLQDHSHPAWQRLKAEELLAQQLSQYQARQERSRLAAPPLQPTAQQAAIVSQLLAALPFALTAAQQRVVQEITADMARLVLSLPLVAMDSVGAGAGSFVRLDPYSKSIKLGPDSAGYRVGTCWPESGLDTVSVSDCHVVLGYLNPDNFLGGAIAPGVQVSSDAAAARSASPAAACVVLAKASACASSPPIRSRTRSPSSISRTSPAGFAAMTVRSSAISSRVSR